MKAENLYLIVSLCIVFLVITGMILYYEFENNIKFLGVILVGIGTFSSFLPLVLSYKYGE